MSNEEEPTRAQLVEAGTRIRRQMEILVMPVGNRNVQTRAMAARLKEQLKDIAELVREKDASEKERRGS